MGMVVNNNIPALQTYNAVNVTSNALQKSIQKLSTGLRINSAADDAAGLAISEKMRAQTRGLVQATRNSQDGISMIQTAEGALNETHSILQRMRELSVQGANDTLTQQDRGYIQLEIDQLREEITRIGNTTQFNKKKLLDGSAAVLWSSDNLQTKAIVNGGLRQIDQFGQKATFEGNYDISIKAKPGQAEIQKTDIFTIKHKNVITNVAMNSNLINDVRVDNLPKGDYAVTAAASGDVPVSITDFYGLSSSMIAGTISGLGGTGATVNVLLEVTDHSTATGKTNVKLIAEILSSSGGLSNVEYNFVISAGTGATALDTLIGKASVFGTGFTIAGMTAGATTVGNKQIINVASAAGGFNVLVSATNLVNNTSTVSAAYSLANTVLGQSVTFKNFYLNKNDGSVTTGSIILDFKSGATITAGASFATFHATQIGDVATSDVKLRDLDKFWDAQGRFMLTDPQSITLTQGDGKQTKVTLYANDTLGDVARKFNSAIGGKDGLNQGQYVTGGSNFATFVNHASGQIESVAGTMVIRSAVTGQAGKITFAGDEDLIKAFSLNTIQDAKESDFTVSITNAHSGVSIPAATITGNKLIGIVHPNIDVLFDAMANTDATWDATALKYNFSAQSAAYQTVLHLADNTTVFQIGANEGEDMGINIGDMRSTALGLNSVLVTDRESAARSITVIDNAMDKVSTQRAKLGAYQNRLEHTINNLTTAGENLTAAESRIRDTDMAKEMMNFTRLNIMLQAGTSMLAQANQLPNNILSLIR